MCVIHLMTNDKRENSLSMQLFMCEAAMLDFKVAVRGESPSFHVKVLLSEGIPVFFLALSLKAQILSHPGHGIFLKSRQEKNYKTKQMDLI